MTVKELLYACKMQVAAGNGDKKVWVSNDDEGNGFHQISYEFTTGEDAADCFKYSDTIIDEAEIANAIILG